MKLTVLAATLVLASACVTELDTSVDEAEVWTDFDRNNLRWPVRIKSTINTSGTGMCMDVAGGYTATNTPIVQYPCHNGLAQQFHVLQIDFVPTYQIRSRLDTRMCVGIRTNNQLALVTCDNASNLANENTKWRADSQNLLQPTPSTIRFRSPSSSTCIDIPGGSSWHSLILQAYGCHAGANQVWEVANL